ncbi:MAG: hypothetical protein AABZ12_06305 [Planctomycetota bacterium]
MKKVVWGLVILLMVLHQDFWWWNDIEPLVLGFVPIGLASHVGVSIAAAAVWGLAVHFCWPEDVDAAETGDESALRPHARSRA